LVEDFEKKIERNEPLGLEDLQNLRNKLKGLKINKESDPFELKKIGLRLWNCGVQLTHKELSSLEVNVQGENISEQKSTVLSSSSFRL
jgi:hypothetical protein